MSGDGRCDECDLIVSGILELWHRAWLEDGLACICVFLFFLSWDFILRGYPGLVFCHILPVSIKTLVHSQFILLHVDCRL
jgi:hypothetical protein